MSRFKRTSSLLLLTGIMVSGCSLLRSLEGLKTRGKTQAKQPATVTSRIDSLWSVPLPADTVVLAPRKEDKIVESEGMLRGSRQPGHADLSLKSTVPGYRVQLASAENRAELEPLVDKIRREMKREAYLKLQGDRYTLRIGDFLDREEAEAERQRAVSYGYKHAWIVQTGIMHR